MQIYSNVTLENCSAYKELRLVWITIILSCLWPWSMISWPFAINTLRLRQNGCHFPDNIFKNIFLNENWWISIKISLKFILNGPINNIPALVGIMAWRRSGDKPLSEPMMVSLLKHICVTCPQWVKYHIHICIVTTVLNLLICRVCTCIHWLLIGYSSNETNVCDCDQKDVCTLADGLFRQWTDLTSFILRHGNTENCSDG